MTFIKSITLRPRPHFLRLSVRPLKCVFRPRETIVLRPQLKEFKHTRPPSYRPIVKKQMEPADWDENWLEWASTVPGFVDAFTKDMEGKVSGMYDYQVEHMLDKSSFRHRDKSRQVGYSYVFSAESLAKVHLKTYQTSIFISMNQDEANEKIRYAESLYDAIPTEFKKALVVRNKQSLEFQSGKTTNRILSFPQRQPRGKGLNTDVYLDEFAHMRDAQAIYTASTPVITRGSGVLTVGSTPLGKSSLHYKIGSEKENFAMFSRMNVPWWWCPDFLRSDVDVNEARKLAPNMSTDDRVMMFGNTKLYAIYKSNPKLEFKQEYEIYYIDSSISYFSLDLIRSCVYSDIDGNELEDNIDPSEIPESWKPYTDKTGKEIVPDTIMGRYDKDKKRKVIWKGFVEDLYFFDEEDFKLRINDLVSLVRMDIAVRGWGRHLFFGYDVGRVNDSAELSLFEEIEFGDFNLHVERMCLGLYDIPFYLQEYAINKILSSISVEGGMVDATGMGSQLGENIARIHSQIIPVKFTPERKGLWARRFKQRLEDRTIGLIDDKRSITQIHSIRRKISEYSNVKYEAEQNTEHHGDKFWSKALASASGNFYEKNLSNDVDYKADDERIISQQNLSQITHGSNKYGRIEPSSFSVKESDLVRFVRGNSGAFNSGSMMSEFFDFKYRG